MTYVFLAITGLFILFLLVRYGFKIKICAICASIFLTWTGLFLLYKTNHYHDTMLLSLLMGQSIGGLYYFARKRLPKILRIFTLPYFLTTTAIVYMLLKNQVILPVFGFLLGLWILAWVIFAYRNDPAKKVAAKAVMECCEDE